jgi:tryptophan 2,3-dioxygenase
VAQREEFVRSALAAEANVSERFVHMKTVERIIGDKRRTGGTAGVPYLARSID